MSYLGVNRRTYDALAREYDRKWNYSLDWKGKSMERFAGRLTDRFSGGIRVLDVGCGPGLSTHILRERGFQATGLDFSKEMIKHAREREPFGTYLEVDFLKYEAQEPYDGVFMDAFLHLFPEDVVPRVLRKTKEVLADEGVIQVGTTISEREKEGFYVKVDYSGGMRRFRRFYTREGVFSALEKGGFRILDSFSRMEPEANKFWLYVLADKA